MAFPDRKWSCLRTTPSSPAIFVESGRAILSSNFLGARYTLALGGQRCGVHVAPPHAQDTVSPRSQTTYMYRIHFTKRRDILFFSCQKSVEVFTGGFRLLIHSGLGIITRTINKSSTRQIQTYIAIPATFAIIRKP